MTEPETFDRTPHVGIFLRSPGHGVAITKMVATLCSRKWAQGVRLLGLEDANLFLTAKLSMNFDSVKETADSGLGGVCPAPRFESGAPFTNLREMRHQGFPWWTEKSGGDIFEVPAAPNQSVVEKRTATRCKGINKSESWSILQQFMPLISPSRLFGI